MRDEASARRLAEMGIDVYVPRGAARAAETSAEPAAARMEPEPADVLLITGAAPPRPPALIADIERALRHARVRCLRTEAPDADALAAAAAVIVCGQARAREIGSHIPTQRQQEIGWVVTGEWQALANGPAKRALWSELRRMLRGIAPARDGR